MQDKKENYVNTAISGAAYETIQRYGSAVKEHLVAYSGIDNEKEISSSVMKKSLKSIKEQKTNSDYEYSIKQQKAGWAAEVKETANANADNIIAGKTKRKIRYDDIPGKSSNNPLYDHAEIDADGNIIVGSETQMKFIGGSKVDPKGLGNAERALKKLQSKEFEKYIDGNVVIEVPKDEYQKMIDCASKELDKLQKQLVNAKKNGNAQTVAKLEKKIVNLKKLKKNLKPSTVSRKEAMEAANSPVISTAKSVVKVAHGAGVEAAEIGAIVGGVSSIIHNVVGMFKDDIEGEEAVKNIAKDTVEATAMGYVTGFGGAAIKATMQNSASEYTRALAKTNFAGTIVTATVSTSKTLKRYFKGEIDGTQCLESLGEQGTGMIASAVFAVIGQMAIPVVGNMIGSVIGYVLSSASYGILISSLKEAKFAREERIAIEKACKEHIQMIRKYRLEMDEIIQKYLLEKMTVFDESFVALKEALLIDDVDLFVESANQITEVFDGNKPFETMDDFNKKMIAGQTFKI